MRVSSAGLSLIKHSESFQAKAYLCPAGKLTLGYGSTGPHVRPGMTITEPQASALLMQDVSRFEKGVLEAVKVSLSQHQFDALVSLAFNIGLGAFRASTLVRKLNAGKFAEAAQQFARWNRGDGRVLPGLIVRRAAEAALFLS